MSEVIFVIHWISTGLGATISQIHKRLINKYNTRNLPVRESPGTDFFFLCTQVLFNVGICSLDFRHSRSPGLYKFSIKDRFPFWPGSV